MEEQITYLSIRDHIKKFFSDNQIKYIHDIRKEINSINKFMMDEIPPLEILELIKKIIEIKKHPKFGKEVFWMGCAANISDAYSYRVKIENLYQVIEKTSSEIKTKISKKTDRTKNIESIRDGILNFAITHLTQTRIEEIRILTFLIENEVVTVSPAPNDFIKNVIEKWMRDEYGLKVIYV